MRKHCRRHVVIPVPPRGLRPKLSRDQVRDLAIVHLQNLDTIARGDATEDTLWEWVAGILTWAKVAEHLEIGQEEMLPQLALAKRLIERYRVTGRVLFSGLDYQLAKDGVSAMDQLAEIVDQHVASEAAAWSEAEAHRMRTRLTYNETPATEEDRPC